MLYREIIAVCSEIHTKHINTQLCGQNVGLLNAEHGYLGLYSETKDRMETENNFTLQMQLRHAQTHTHAHAHTTHCNIYGTRAA